MIKLIAVLISLTFSSSAFGAASIVPAFGTISSAGNGSKISAAQQGTNTLQVIGSGGATISLTKVSSKPKITIGLDSTIVKTSGDQSIGDVKTFTSAIVSPNTPPNQYFIGAGSYASIPAAISALGSTPALVTYSTDQTLAANLSVPATIELVPTNGAKIVHGSYTISYLGSSSRWPVTQIFDGTGLVSGLVDIKSAWFTPAASAGATAVTAGIQASINALASLGSWELSPGSYTTNSELVFDDLSRCKISFKGQIVNDTTSAVKLRNMNYCTVSGLDIGRSAYSWAGEHSGVTLDGYFLNSTVGIIRIAGYKYGLNLTATSGTSTGIGWNQITLGEIRDNQYGIWAITTGDGWINANNWHGGSIRLTGSVKTAEAATDNWAVYFNDVVTYVYQGNNFYGLRQEQLINGIRLTGAYNFYMDVRSEAVTNDYITAISGAGLTIVPGATFEADKYNISTNMRGITVLGASEYSASKYKSLLFDDKYGGISFASFADPDNTAVGISTDYINYPGTVQVTSWITGTQRFDKQFTGSAAPTTGTYNANAVVWNDTISPGAPVGWVATRSGTMNTIATTGSINIGTAELTVSSTAGLKIGQYINVAGAVFAGQIRAISGTTVTISSNATGTVTDAAVTNYAALWQALPPYQTTGTGTPEGSVTAPVGTIYINNSGGASTTLYIKTSGTGNTGWTAK